MRRVVVVTGASTGIGAAVVADLARSGFRCFGTVRRDVDEANVRASGAEPLRMDVADSASVAGAVANLRERLAGEQVWGVIHNAGIAGAGPWELLEEQTLRETFEVNLFGVARLNRLLLPDLRASRGRVVLMSSVSGRFGFPAMGPYCASKFALEALADTLRRELRPFGVHVTSIQPGPIDTPIWEKSLSRFAEMYPTSTAYEMLLQKLERGARDSAKHALPVSAVTAVVRRVLLSRRPPVRRIVLPWKARMALAIFEWLPSRWIDRLVAGRFAAGSTRDSLKESG